ncbi:acyltransferase family protein [Butyricicoccus faecihominis]|uniref:acyltransferase family protein n=1 Tax=Butyricicoccus faecihominis TaxID=1712515 RepID=UPI0024794896|nr:acyltransferase family protein [Butyricicoccus faecihominis]MCQ5129402.1 acyltransferase family protein [Butyricicoccus faecihominis]
MNKDKLYRIAGINIACAFLVFLFNCHIHLHVHYFILTSFISKGATAMTGFFMVSGFVLFRLYSKTDFTEQGTSVLFYKNRIFSFYPLYLAVYLLYLVFFNWNTLFENLMLAPIELILLQSFFDSLFPMLHNGGTWFLSCLLFCFIVFPFLQETIKRLRKYLSSIICLLIGGSILFPFIVSGLGLGSIFSSPFMRLVEFSIGMIIAATYGGSSRGNFGIKLFMLALTYIVGVTLLNKISIFTNDYPLYNIISIPIFALSLFWADSCGPCSLDIILKSRFVTLLNKALISFYMAQIFTFPIVNGLSQNFQKHTNWINLGGALAINVLIAFVFYYGIEKPARKYLHSKYITG